MPPKPSPPTHFLCIPLAGAHLARSLAAFRADVTSPLSFNVPTDAVRPLGTLHLTLGVMSLRGDSLKKALEVLRGLRPADALAAARAGAASPKAPAAGDKPSATTSPGDTGDGPLAISLQGLRPMQAASKTSVLFAPPADPDGVLYRFCQNLRQPFLDSGLITDDRPLLLHATIVNTIYVRGRARGDRRHRMTLDARDLLTRYDSYVWMEDMPVDCVTLCRMGAKRIEGSDGDEAYEVEAEVRF